MINGRWLVQVFQTTFVRERMTKGNDIEERLIAFAVRIVHVTKALPSNVAGRHLGNQLVRSGTAPALLYGEARAAAISSTKCGSLSKR